MAHTETANYPVPGFFPGQGACAQPDRSPVNVPQLFKLGDQVQVNYGGSWTKGVVAAVENCNAITSQFVEVSIDHNGERKRLRLNSNEIYNIRKDLAASHSPTSLKDFCRDAPYAEDPAGVYSVVRLRPASSSEQSCAEVQGPRRVMYRDGNEARYQRFDRVFSPGSQEEIYAEVGAKLVDKVLGGGQAALLAYGHPASGKTFTMMGVLETEAPPDHKNMLHCQRWPRKRLKLQDKPLVGLLPRIAQGIFANRGARKLSMHVSMVEIVGDRNGTTTRDLLKDQIKNLQWNRTDPQARQHLFIRKCKNRGGYYAVGAKKLCVKDTTGLLNLLDRGFEFRSTAEDADGQLVSRSHCVVTIYIQTKRGRGQLTMVDLCPRSADPREQPCAMPDFAKQRHSANARLDEVLVALRAAKKRTYIKHSNTGDLARLLEAPLSEGGLAYVLATASPTDQDRDGTVDSFNFAQLK